jgi:DNA (cytosine-5)-methyltransferase 1
LVLPELLIISNYLYDQTQTDYELATPVQMTSYIPVIDIFAGPGGLGEGFSAFKSGNAKVFKIKLSIEKDSRAHQTLELRAFFRQFDEDSVPFDYYEYLRGKVSREDLFKNFPVESCLAKEEAWNATLGVEDGDTVNARIKKALNGASSWVLIGGPPCQAYSIVGRSRMLGGYNGEYHKDPRHFLYREYLQILADHEPPVFVMENVKGLLSSKVQQQKTFDLILSDLRNPAAAMDSKSSKSLSYRLFSISNEHPKDKEEIRPENFIVRSEEYGIPQARHRLIILGIRSDVYDSNPEILGKSKKQISIDAVIGDLPRLRSGLSKKHESAEEWRNSVKEIESANWIPSISSELQQAITSSLKRVGSKLDRGASFLPFIVSPKEYYHWYVDEKLGGVCNHETRTHIKEDLHRYFFAAVFARKYKRSPKLKDFPVKLLPNHDNVQNATENMIFLDRFRVQVVNKPSTTVVSHISKDGHYYIHYDPSQCRSLTVREAARLQTFPDNYFFEGNRTRQYQQVGNAVPPLLAYKIAEIVAKLLNAR